MVSSNNLLLTDCVARGHGAARPVQKLPWTNISQYASNKLTQ